MQPTFRWVGGSCSLPLSVFALKLIKEITQELHAESAAVVSLHGTSGGRHALATRQSPGTLSCCPELTPQGATPPALVLGIRALPLLSSISSSASRFRTPCALHCPWSSKEGVLCSSRVRTRKRDYRASFSTDQLGTSPSHLSPLTQWLYLRTKERANWPPLGRRRARTEAKATGFTGSPVTVPESEHRKGSRTHFPSPTLAEPALLRPTKWGESPMSRGHHGSSQSKQWCS